MKTLIIMHVESEGPGTLGHYLETISAGVQTARLYAGERLPEAAEAFSCKDGTPLASAKRCGVW